MSDGKGLPMRAKIPVLLIPLLAPAAAPLAAGEAPDPADPFVSGQGGYHTYRIPAIAVAPKGAVLLFCEGRKGGSGDSGDIDILLRRSLDGGRTWSPVQTVVDAGPDTAGNPAPVVDGASGKVVLLITRNPGGSSEADILKGKGERTVWVASSGDDGATWSAPREITASVKRPGWTWYATGPCHGIRLRTGRLLVPCDHVEGPSADYAVSARSHVISSDDGGKTWSIGGIIGPGCNESTVAELSDGTVVMNSRNYVPPRRRAVARSRDGGLTFGERTWDDGLPEPICQASLLAADGPAGAGRVLLFSNPADRQHRIRMTLRSSGDGGRTWTAGRVLWEGPSAYSDLAAIPGGTVLCAFERGVKGPYEKISVASISTPAP
jgi:sialidase-1